MIVVDGFAIKGGGSDNRTILPNTCLCVRQNMLCKKAHSDAMQNASMNGGHLFTSKRVPVVDAFTCRVSSNADCV